MSKIIFRMRYVPQDEAQEVRDLLKENDIDFFETFAGNWSISVPALWVKHDEQFSRARRIIEDYQIERTKKVKQEFSEHKNTDKNITVRNIFSESPSKFIGSVFAIFIVLYISLRFFLSF